MPDAPPNLARLLQTLHVHNVRFVLIGGLAMVVYGSAHVTEDIDIVYSRDTNNLPAVVRALAPLHPSLRGIAEDVPFALDDLLIMKRAAGRPKDLAHLPELEALNHLAKKPAE